MQPQLLDLDKLDQRLTYGQILASVQTIDALNAVPASALSADAPEPRVTGGGKTIALSGTAFGRPIPTSMLNLHRRSFTRSRTDSNRPPGRGRHQGHGRDPQHSGASGGVRPACSMPPPSPSMRS